MAQYDDVVTGTISEVKEFVNDNTVDIDKVLAAEKKGKDRKTLKKWLREQRSAAARQDKGSQDNSDTLTFSISPMQAVIASFLVGIFVGGFFMSAIGGGMSPTGALTDPGSQNSQEAEASKPQVSKIDLEGEPVLGSEDAPVTMVMYEDYQCPFCKRFETQTMPQIKSNYVDSGQLKVVWKDFPAPGLGHDWAEPAAAAMECVYREAGDEVFWPVKDTLFDRAKTLTRGEEEFTVDTIHQEIISMAADNGASASAIQSCIDNQNPMQEVNGDKQEAQSFDATISTPQGQRPFVSGTPSFVVFAEGDAEAEPIVGAQPYSRFSSIIDQKLG